MAGAERVTVSVRGTGRERAARVVAFDPARDVAVLEVADLEAPAVGQGAALDAGAQAALAGFPGDNGLWVGAARVRDVLRARGADIYGAPDVARQIYSLRAQVRRGASGGPVIDRRRRTSSAWSSRPRSTTPTPVTRSRSTRSAPVLRRGVLAAQRVSTGACVSG